MCGRAGLESVGGTVWPFVVGGRVWEWCGHAFGFPDRHRQDVGSGVVSDAAMARGWFLCGPVACGGVCWWFENWIVDASRSRLPVFWGFVLVLLISFGLRCSLLDVGVRSVVL